MNNFLSKAIFLLALIGAANFAAFGGGISEKSVLTDAKVSVSFCVAAGEVTVRGWERSEVRAMVDGGAVGFEIKERGEDNKPQWLMIVGFEPKNGVTVYQKECLKARNIEIEVPFGASVGIKTGDNNGESITIDSISKVKIESISNDIQIRNLKQETFVSSLSGNITVEDSNGKFRLKSFEGDIIAQRLRPNEFSDGVEMSSASGSVMLRDVRHKTIDAGSSNGELTVSGALTAGGTYDFDTVGGKIMLELPQDFPFRIKSALVTCEHFKSDFPTKFNKTVSGQSCYVTGSNGAGETPINITAFNGIVFLKKK